MSELLERLLDNRAYVLLAVGGIFVALGIVGQVTGWFPGIDPVFRWVAIGIGGAILLVGIILVIADGGSKNPYGIHIVTPADQSSQEEQIDVRGTIRRSLPKEKELWLLRIYPNHDEFLPMRKVQIGHGGSWTAMDCHLGGRPGDPRIIGAYVVEESARALLDLHRDASQQHNSWMDKLNVPTDAKDRYLRPIQYDPAKLKNMKRCVEVSVLRK